MNIVSSVTGFEKLKRLRQTVKDEGLVRISPLFGSSKSILIKELLDSENQIVVLLPDAQRAAEFHVELDVLGISEFSLSLTEIKSETLQEKLTEISKRERFILSSTYEILNCILPPQRPN